MERTRAIAALMGPLLMVNGMLLLVDLGWFDAVVADLVRVPMLMVLAGYATFVPGVALVYWHSRWDRGVLPVVVTVLSWVFLAAGVALIVWAYALAGVLVSLTAAMSPWLALVGVMMVGGGGWMTFEGWWRRD